MNKRLAGLLVLPLGAALLSACSYSNGDNAEELKTDESGYLAAVAQYEGDGLTEQDLLREGNSLCQSMTDSTDAAGIYDAITRDESLEGSSLQGDTLLGVLDAAVTHLCPQWAELAKSS